MTLEDALTVRDPLAPTMGERRARAAILHIATRAVHDLVAHAITAIPAAQREALMVASMADVGFVPSREGWPRCR